MTYSKYNFCTLFDRYYFSRGIALYESLKEHSDNFHLYIFAFDDESYQKLTKLNLEHTTIISLNEFEDQQLLAVKQTRTKAEYCWTTTSSTILYAIRKFNLESCTYIDADICFYSNPQEIFNEIGDASIALTLHNYSKLYDQSSTSGKYCVQFVYFKNDLNGIAALEWWRNACLDWCFARLENGKFGDQKYLDDWTERFKKVHVIKNLGAGIALWNAQRFNITKNDNEFFIHDFVSNKDYNLIFYHFHGLKYVIKNESIIVEATKFKFNSQLKELLYIPYIHKLSGIDNPDNINQNITFLELSPIAKLLLPIHFMLKKFIILQKIKALFVRSMK